MDDESARAAVLHYLRSCVPTLPPEFGEHANDRLMRAMAHADAQAVIMATMNIVPHVDRSAFSDLTTIADLVEWIAPELTIGADKLEEPVTRPRGSYATAAATLRPIFEEDVLPAYEASIDPRLAHRWRFRGQTPSLERFRAELFSPAILVQFTVIKSDDPERHGVGIVNAYDADLSDGVVSVAFHRFVHNDDGGGLADNRGLMVEGILILIQYLFDHFTFRKVYIEVPEFNLDLFEHGKGEIFQKEAHLRDHFYYGDRYWSQIVFALYRERWDAVAEPFRGEWPESHGNTHLIGTTPGLGG